MAMGSLQRRGKGRYRPLAEINVTPLVDVMLVLLIVFMVAAPLMNSGINVDLPKASANPISQDSEPLTVVVNAEGKIYLQDTELQMSNLAAKLGAIADGKMDRRIYVRGDKALNYGAILQVMSTITQAGFTKVALLVDASGAPSAPAAPTRPAAAPAAPAAPAAAVPAQPTAPAVPPQGRR